MRTFTLASALVGLSLAIGCAGQKKKVATAPTPVAQPAAKEKAPEAPVPAAFAFSKIYFETNSSVLSDGALATLAKLAAHLEANPKVNLVIEGHCDERGTEDYNLALGDHRARTIQRHLQRLGIDPKRLAILSFGKLKPAVEGTGEQAWSKNRRAEFLVGRGPKS